MKKNSEFDSKLGKRLRKIRKSKNVTQKQLSEKLNISFQQVQKYEVGENSIYVSRLLKICNLLKVDFEDFFLTEKELENKKITIAFNKLSKTNKLLIFKFLDN